MAKESRVENTYIKKTVFHVYLIFYCKLVMEVSGNTCSYKRLRLLPNFNDKKPSVSPLKQVSDFTKMDCAKLCHSRDDCRSFVFSPNSRECLVYSKTIYSSGSYEPQNSPGMRRYDIVAEDCYDVMKNGASANGKYKIIPRDDGKPIMAYCDLISDNGAWLVFQRRTGAKSQDFYKNWNEYKDGFGDLNEEFWLGNANIHRLTKQRRYELRVELEDFDGNKKYALYNEFSIDSEKENFRLKVGQYSGTAGDALGVHNGKNFSTYDKDLDLYKTGNCARHHHGAWWFTNCCSSHLNGRYYDSTYKDSTDRYDAIMWYYWKGPQPLKRTVMKIRPAIESGNN